MQQRAVESFFIVPSHLRHRAKATASLCNADVGISRAVSTEWFLLLSGALCCSAATQEQLTRATCALGRAAGSLDQTCAANLSVALVSSEAFPSLILPKPPCVPPAQCCRSSGKHCSSRRARCLCWSNNTGYKLRCR